MKGIKVGGLEYNRQKLDRAMKMYASTFKTYLYANGGEVGSLMEAIEYAELNEAQKEFLKKLDVLKGVIK